MIRRVYKSKAGLFNVRWNSAELIYITPQAHHFSSLSLSLAVGPCHVYVESLVPVTAHQANFLAALVENRLVARIRSSVLDVNFGNRFIERQQALLRVSSFDGEPSSIPFRRSIEMQPCRVVTMFRRFGLSDNVWHQSSPFAALQALPCSCRPTRILVSTPQFLSS